MSRITWRDGKVFSLETRDGIFVLAQMLKPPYVVFFNVFNDSHNWSVTHLNSVSVLYVAGVTRQFISKSNVKYQKQIQPTKPPLPRLWVKPNFEMVYRTIWTGTAIEMTIAYQGNHGGALIERE